MTRIRPIDPGDANDRRQELLAGVQRRLGMLPNLIRTMAHSEATLAGYLGLSGALAKGALAQREREQIAVAIAEANGCGYCLAAHTAAGKVAGLSDLELLDARRGSATSTREAAILALAVELAEQRGRISDEALRRAREAGLTDGELTEIVANVALQLFTNYLNLAARTEIDFPPAPVLEAVQA